MAFRWPAPKKSTWQQRSFVRMIVSTMVKRATSRSAELTTRCTALSSRFAAPMFVPSACARPTEERTGNMATKPKFDPERHEENPAWTARDFAKAKPASEVLPAEVIAQFRNKGGRPRAEPPKQAVKLRIDADVLARLRDCGAGWQTRINGILRAAAPPRAAKKVVSGKKRSRSKSPE